MARATGGTITTSGLYTIHTFTSNGTFTPDEELLADYLIVAGGGAGGYKISGGGGAGGVLQGTERTVTAQAYPIVIGAGGVSAVSEASASGNGGNSTFDGLTAIGGGGGGTGDGNPESVQSGQDGGSGGGSSYPGTTYWGDGTSGQGYDGAAGGGNYAGGGGGGAGEAGHAPVDGDNGGDGGDGIQSSISGSSVYYAGGGGGGCFDGTTGGDGGQGGGGSGGMGGGGTAPGTAGTANTGGGGGGGGDNSVGGAGGTGVVIIRYLTIAPTGVNINETVEVDDSWVVQLDVKASGGTITFDGNYTVHTFTENGTFTPRSIFDIDYLIVAGGGGAGARDYTSGGGGGGILTDTGHQVTAKAYPIVIGAGGVPGSNGDNSTFDSLTALGGGHGVNLNAGVGANGGCGGGGGGKNSAGTSAGGTGSQGGDGGSGTYTGTNNFPTGGGGGAGGNGVDGTGSQSGNGGAGYLSPLHSTPTYFAGGGGGGGYSPSGCSAGLGVNGGGNGNATAGGAGSDGTANTGGGGGGGAGGNGVGGSGGSGIVVIRYLTADPSSVQLTPSLEWAVSAESQLTPSLEWVGNLPHKFIPNVLNYDFYYETPKIIDSSVPMSISGCAVGYSIYLGNTGSSGDTVIEIYANDTLKDTVTITADGDSSSTVEYFDLSDLLSPQQTLQIKVTEVAVDSSDLKINMYLMTFPFEMDILYYSNLSDSVNFTGINKEYLFNSSDYWYIDFNQPISSIANVRVIDDNGNETDATYSLINGNFYNSRLQITPHTASFPRQIRVKLKDYNNTYHVFKCSPKVFDYVADYQEYVSDASNSFDLFIAATSSRYSFDAGVTWSDWLAVSSYNKSTIDFSGQSAGDKAIKVQYRIGYETVEEDISIYYATGDIQATIVWRDNYAEINYSDGVPLDLIEIYYDDVLSKSSLPVVISGFETFTLNTVTKAVEIDAGSISVSGKRYAYDGTDYDLSAIDFPANDYAIQYRVLFGFNTTENAFETRLVSNSTSFNNAFETTYNNFIAIWGLDFSVIIGAVDFSSYSIVDGGNSPTLLFSEGRVYVNLNGDKEITVKLKDLTGRTLDFTQDYKKVVFNIWRYLSVSKDSILASSYEGSYYPKLAIDGSNDFWMSDSSLSAPAWLKYEFGVESTEAIVEVSITADFSDADSHPKDFKIQGSNDSDTWTDLHTVTGETWSDDGPKVYSFTNTTEYAFYRLYITDSSGGDYVRIKELELRKTIGGSDETSFTQTEIFPGELHQNEELTIDITSEDWGTSPDGPTK